MIIFRLSHLSRQNEAKWRICFLPGGSFSWWSTDFHVGVDRYILYIYIYVYYVWFDQIHFQRLPQQSYIFCCQIQFDSVCFLRNNCFSRPYRHLKQRCWFCLCCSLWVSDKSRGIAVHSFMEWNLWNMFSSLTYFVCMSIFHVYAHTHMFIYIYIHLYIHIDLQTCMCMVQFFPCLFIVSDPQVFLMMVHWNTWKNHEKHLRRSTTIWSTWPKVDWPLEMRACCWMSRIIFSKGWTNVVFWWTGFG